MAPPPSPDRHKILLALASGPVTAHAITLLCNRSKQSTHQLLKRMAAAGLIVKVGQGQGHRSPAWCVAGPGLEVLKNTDGPG